MTGRPREEAAAEFRGVMEEIRTLLAARETAALAVLPGSRKMTPEEREVYRRVWERRATPLER